TSSTATRAKRQLTSNGRSWAYEHHGYSPLLARADEGRVLSQAARRPQNCVVPYRRERLDAHSVRSLGVYAFQSRGLRVQQLRFFQTAAVDVVLLATGAGVGPVPGENRGRPWPRRILLQYCATAQRREVKGGHCPGHERKLPSQSSGQYHAGAEEGG